MKKMEYFGAIQTFRECVTKSYIFPKCTHNLKLKLHVDLFEYKHIIYHVVQHDIFGYKKKHTNDIIRLQIDPYSKPYITL